ncbi:MAG: hypothetical protein GTN83_08430 [Acidobacteria bacterium]|nr:hypothetical protein [Acidobacteriota bacterium]
MVNRKLVRPNLAQLKSRMGDQRGAPDAQRGNGAAAAGQGKRRPAPAESTNAEAFYYLKQMNTQTPMVVVLDNGEELRGHIEWYDRGCLKVHRDDGPNLLVYKHSIRYLYKAEEAAN